MSRLVAGAVAAAVLLALGASLVNANDAENGADVFRKCQACHQVGETAKNATGPKLNGLFGRSAGTVDGFTFSEANRTSGVVWDEKNFAAYIKDPRTAMPGNKMAFAGIKDDEDVSDLIAFLKLFDASGKKK